MVSQKEIIEEINKLIEASIDEVGYQYALGKLLQLANRIESEGIAPPDGWQLVPIRPTWEIEYAIANARNLSAKESWADALASAPKQEVKS